MLDRPLPVRAELSWVVWIMSDNPALAGGVRKLSRTFWVVQSLRSPKLGDICIFVCSYTHIFCDIEMYLYCHRGCFPRPWGYLEAREMRNIKNFMCLQKKKLKEDDERLCLHGVPWLTEMLHFGTWCQVHQDLAGCIEVFDLALPSRVINRVTLG